MLLYKQFEEALEDCLVHISHRGRQHIHSDFSTGRLGGEGSKAVDLSARHFWIKANRCIFINFSSFMERDS